MALKVADAEPDATLTEEGTVSAALLLERATDSPPLVAGWESVTVQVDFAPFARLLGLHWSDEIAGEGGSPGPPIGVIMSA